jgi:ElaB/YqjD/DUF883 family membrane-anchored ribosome-binding protein
MRDRDGIQREFDAARAHLERDLSQLRHVIADKLDVKKRAKQAVQRGTSRLLELGRRLRAAAREHPWTAIAILTGATVLLARSRIARRRARAC